MAKKGKQNGHKPRIETRAIHAGEGRRRLADSLTTPIIQTSTFTFENSQDIENYTRKGIDHYEYGRYGNPTASIAEKRLADLEGAEDCVVFSSGMSAITTTILALVQSGDHIVITDDSYKKTLEFCRSYLKQFSIDCTIVPFGDYQALEKAIPEEHSLHLFRVTNQSLPQRLRDLVKIKEIAQRHKVLTLIDSNLCDPLQSASP